MEPWAVVVVSVLGTLLVGGALVRWLNVTRNERAARAMLPHMGMPGGPPQPMAAHRPEPPAQEPEPAEDTDPRTLRVLSFNLGSTDTTDEAINRRIDLWFRGHRDIGGRVAHPAILLEGTRLVFVFPASVPEEHLAGTED